MGDMDFGRTPCGYCGTIFPYSEDLVRVSREYERVYRYIQDLPPPTSREYAEIARRVLRTRIDSEKLNTGLDEWPEVLPEEIDTKVAFDLPTRFFVGMALTVGALFILVDLFPEKGVVFAAAAVLISTGTLLYGFYRGSKNAQQREEK
jgi:hypothetical protein